MTEIEEPATVFTIRYTPDDKAWRGVVVEFPALTARGVYLDRVAASLKRMIKARLGHDRFKVQEELCV